MHAAPPPVEPHADTAPVQRRQRDAKANVRIALIAIAAVTVVLLAWAWGVKELSQRIGADMERTVRELPVAGETSPAAVAD